MIYEEERYGKGGDKIQFIRDNLFFHISSNILELYSIEGSKFILEKKVKMKIDLKNAKIFDLNDEFYCLNEKTKHFFLLNKDNLVIAKTITTNVPSLGMIKISDKIISIITCEDNQLMVSNCIISSNGIKWLIKKPKNLLDAKVINFFRNNNYIAFLIAKGNNKGFDCSLFEIIPQ